MTPERKRLLTRARESGCAAYQDGVRRSQNPHGVFGGEAERWADGWDEAERECAAQLRVENLVALAELTVGERLERIERALLKRGYDL